MALTVEVNPFTGDLQLLNDGSALNFEDSVANAAALPPTGNTENDARITNDDGHIWIWNGSSWVDEGNFIDVNWDSIIGKPTSSPTDIDDAVAKRHDQNTDTKLDEGNPNEVTAAELRDALDNIIPFKADKVDPFANHTLLLMHFDGADNSTTFTDEIGHTIHSVVGTPHIDTAESQFGGSSLRIDNGNTIRIDDSPDWDFGTSDFTIECWAKFESHAGEYRVILARGVYYDQPSLNWGYQPTNDRIDFQINTDTGSHIYGFIGSAPTDGVWYHLAIVRTGGTIDMYKNGVQLSKTVSGGEIGTSSVNNTNKQLEIGGVADFPAQNFVGWLEEFRISDTARYTASFTPPASPFDLECDLNIALLAGADGNLVDSDICHERLDNALTDAHMQGTDATLDFGGVNEVSAEEIRTHIDDLNNPHQTTADQIATNDSGITVQDKLDEIDSKTSAYRNSFVDADLSSGILTVTHGLGEKYVTVQVYDNNDKLIVPDEVTLTNTTTLTIDLSSFGTLTGTWNYIVVG